MRAVGGGVFRLSESVAAAQGGDRLTKVLTGHSHNYEKLLLKASWSPDGTMVGMASSDCLCYVYDTATRAIKYRLPGHTGSVNEVGGPFAA